MAGPRVGYVEFLKFRDIHSVHFELSSTLKSGSPGVTGLSQITVGLAGPDFLAKSR